MSLHPITWRRDPGDTWTVLFWAKDTHVRLVPDATYPGMWRVRSPEGMLSDMVNLSRAKEAGISMAWRRIRRQRLAGESESADSCLVLEEQ